MLCSNVSSLHHVRHDFFHFACMIQELEELWCYQELLGNFVKRLAYCVTVELIPLMDIPGVKLVSYLLALAFLIPISKHFYSNAALLICMWIYMIPLLNCLCALGVLIGAFSLKGRAKQLYTAGFHSLQKVASAPAKALVNAIEHLSHKAAHQIISSAQVKCPSALVKCQCLACHLFRLFHRSCS